jgi:cell division protease FtsH
MIFLGRELSEERDYGDKVAEEIDEEVKGLIIRAYTEANDILVNHKPKLVLLAEYLIEHETVSGEALNHLFNGEQPGTEPGGVPVVPPEPPPHPAPRPQPTIQPRPAPTLPSTSGQDGSSDEIRR